MENFVEPLQYILSPLQGLLFALTFAFAKTLGLTLFFPIFNWIGQANLVRNAIAIAFALPMVPFIQDQMATHSLSVSFEMLALMGKEAFIGCLIGLFMALPFWAALTAGEMLDTYRGASASNLFDPNGAVDSPVSGLLFQLTMICLFMISGGMDLVLGAVYTSYEFWPPMSPWPDLTFYSASKMGAIIDQFLKSGIILAAPIVIAMFLAEASLAFASRLGQRIQVHELSTAIKSVIYVFLMPIYAMFIVTYYKPELAIATSLVDRVRGWFPAVWGG